jgi:hypothetical protein
MFHVSCETASSDRGFRNVTGICRSSVSSCSQKAEIFVVLLCRQFKSGRPIRNMVKCQRAQYDLILYVIGVGVSWWECAYRVSFHGNMCRYGAWCCAVSDGGTC